MSLFRTVRRMTTAAVVMTAAAVSVAAPAVARPPAVGPVLTGSWQASHAGATASGTQTVRQDPLGVAQTRTIKGLIRTGSASGCFHVTIEFGSTTWESPATCAGETPESFVTSFQTFQIVRPPATLRLCTGKDCGAPTSLW